MELINEAEERWGWKISKYEIYDKPKTYMDESSNGKKITKTIIGNCIMDCQICKDMSEHNIYDVDHIQCINCGVTKYIQR